MAITATSIRRRVDVDGQVLAVTEYAGPPSAPDLILLHGIGSSGESWLPVVERLSEHVRLIVPDLRGHGTSDKPDHGYLVPDYARDLGGLLRGLAIDRPLLLGHSLGGLISLSWATEHPSTASGIVIEDSPLRGGPRVLPRFDEWIEMNQMAPDQLAARYAREHPDWSATDCRRRAKGMTSVALPVFTEMRAANVAPEQEDRIAPHRVIESPVLLVHGDLETGGMVVPNDAVRFVAELPRAATVRIPGAGHSIHRDRPQPFLDAMIPFLLEVSG